MASEAARRALAAIDQAHAADPQNEELAYVEKIQSWIGKLVGNPSEALTLAARAQHLERWVIPRAQFPNDRVGYHQWRKAVQKRQGERAAEILRSAGCDDTLPDRVGSLVAKATPKSDAEGQALEDAACLVFLETELAKFAAEHRDYTRERFIEIIRKTWAKMSAQGRELALTIPLPPELSELVRAAVTG